MAKQFSRKALYELIWSKPMRDAAADVGISDVGLVKACRGAAIPIPPRGHWNKVHAGKPTYILELSPRPPGVPDEVIIGGGRYAHYYHQRSEDDDDDREPTPPVFDEDLDSVLTRIRDQIGRVSIPKSLASPHRLVEKLLQSDEDRRQQQIKDGHAYSWNTPIFDAPFERRRLKLLNAIFVALDHEGYTVSMRGKEARDLYVQVGRQSLSFDLDAASLKKTPDWRYQYHPTLNFEGNEKLKFQIWHSVETPGMQWSWLDGDQKLETQLSDIVAHLILAAEVFYRRHIQQQYEWRVQRLIDLREERRQAKAEAERQERLRIEQEKRARVQQLIQEAKNMRRAREIREYVSAVQAATKNRVGNVERITEWSGWAMQLASQIDPLQEERLKSKFESET